MCSNGGALNCQARTFHLGKRALYHADKLMQRTEQIAQPSDLLPVCVFPIRFQLLLDITACVLTEELFFYYSHRLLHTPYFYQHVHKIHHEYKAPFGMASEYAHPFEYVVGNLVSIDHLINFHLSSYCRIEAQIRIYLPVLYVATILDGPVTNWLSYLFRVVLVCCWCDWHHQSPLWICIPMAVGRTIATIP